MLLKRLIKVAAVCLLACLFVLPSATGDCQTQRLPRATFQRFSSSLPPVSGSDISGAGVPSNISSTPGLHLTTGESRTRQNATAPYNPGEPSLGGALVRWQRSKMPLLIWISPGLKLPDAPFDTLQQTRPQTVQKLLKEQYPFANLPKAKGWTEETNQDVARGVEMWRQFQDEGLISFGFVRDPREAHILVFFVGQFKGAAGPGGLNVGGLTCARVFTLDEARYLAEHHIQMPVVIELSTLVNHEPERMQAAAAHEFGHALGIKAHSPYREDIMYADRIVTTLSEGDKNTLRQLYRLQPKYVM